MYDRIYFKFLFGFLTKKGIFYTDMLFSAEAQKGEGGQPPKPQSHPNACFIL